MSKKTNSSIAAKIFFWLSSYIGYTLWQAVEKNYNLGFWDIILPAIVVVILGEIGEKIFMSGRKITQEVRDKEAEEIYIQILRNKIVPIFFIYLRPFSTTNRLTGDNIRTPVPLSPDYYNTKKIDWEEKIANALTEYGDLIGLGKPGEATGIGRIAATEKKWKVAVKNLYLHCQHIFVIPGFQKGIVWEVNLLKEVKILDKCTFIVPSMLGDLSKDYLKLTREAFEEIGLKFPEEINSRNGIIIAFNNNGSVRKSADLPSITDSDRIIGRTLKTFFSIDESEKFQNLENRLREEYKNEQLVVVNMFLEAILSGRNTSKYFSDNFQGDIITKNNIQFYSIDDFNESEVYVKIGCINHIGQEFSRLVKFTLKNKLIKKIKSIDLRECPLEDRSL
jgi:hypothetical protein